MTPYSYPPRPQLNNKTIYRYYSQYGEDFILWNFFDYKANGFFVDVGAFDGIHLSNTYSFEQQGWKGICVEPNPAIFEFCKKNRPNSFCVNAACVADDKAGEIELYFDTTGLFSGLEIDVEADNIKGHYSTLKKEIASKKEKVKALTLNAIIKQCPADIGAIDFISIDVEGAELDVLKGFDLGTYLPRLILLEASDAEGQKIVTDYLLIYGYMFARKHFINSYFVKDINDIEKINSIEVTCVIEKQIHPMGVDYTIPNYYKGIYIYKNRIAKNLIQNLENQVQRNDTEIIRRDRQISEKDRQISEKDRQISEKDRLICEMDGQIFEKDRQISEKDRQISEKDRQISEKDRQISEKDRQISQTLNSYSYRIGHILLWPLKKILHK